MSFGPEYEELNKYIRGALLWIAPEGATHVILENENFYTSFYKQEGGRLYSYSNKVPGDHWIDVSYFSDQYDPYLFSLT